MKNIFGQMSTSRNFQDLMGVARGLHKIRKEVIKRYPFVLDDLHRFEKRQETVSDFDFSVFQGPDKAKSTSNSSEDDSAKIKQNESKVQSDNKNYTSNASTQQKDTVDQNSTSKSELLKNESFEKKNENNTDSTHKIRKVDSSGAYKFDYQNYLKKNEDKFVNAVENKVPSTSFGRAFEWAKTGTAVLGASSYHTAMGAIGLGNKIESKSGQSQFLLNIMTESNAERLSLSLCKMRGAALKVGQALAIQEEGLVPKPIQEAFEKAKQSANIMPQAQLFQTLDTELGYGWREKFQR